MEDYFAYSVLWFVGSVPDGYFRSSRTLASPRSNGHALLWLSRRSESYFQVENHVGRRGHGFLQEPGFCAREVSFLFQALLTITGYPGNGWNGYSKVAYVASKIWRFLPLFFWWVQQYRASYLSLWRHFQDHQTLRNFAFVEVPWFTSGRNVSSLRLLGCLLLPA